MTLLVAKLIWGLGCIAYYIIRYPHQRRARKSPIADRRERIREQTLMAISYTGLFIVPLIYVPPTSESLPTMHSILSAPGLDPSF